MSTRDFKLGMILGTGFGVDEMSGWKPQSDGVIRWESEDLTVVALKRQANGEPPHLVDYKGNMQDLGGGTLDALITTTACGSLAADCSPGQFVVPDNMVDLAGHTHSFIQDIQHPAASLPFDPDLFAGLQTVFGSSDTGTIVSIRGPRFATAAEAKFYASQGWRYINMTTGIEVSLALELGVPVAVLGYVTDFDTYVNPNEPTSIELIRSRMEDGNRKFAELLPSLIEQVRTVKP